MTRKTVAVILCGLTAAFLLFCGGYFLGHRTGSTVTVRSEQGVTESNATEAAPLRLTPETERREERIDLNAATREELETLPGIGPVLAERILNYREEHGPFEALSDLLLVEGIGKKTLENIEPYLIVR